jgi:hypothetical protein
MALWGKTDADASVPKYIHSVTEKTHIYFVDIAEAQVASTRAKGITGPGWWKYTTYTTSTGKVRHKAERLIPMKVTAVKAGDRADDTVLPDA